MVGPRVLLTTICRPGRFQFYEYFGTNIRTRFRITLPQYQSWGLRFLKQNIPELHILEYPTHEEYAAKLREGWDVVGVSFFLHETVEALKMARMARQAGVRETWAGGYGALTPGIAGEFDRIFIGYAERAVASVFGRTIEDIVHPPLFAALGLGPVGLQYKVFGVLFSQRGCAFRCRFCQTPFFCPKPYRISLESIERTLRCYKGQGIREILIFDECFGGMKEHSAAVVDLLVKHGFYWHGLGLRARTLEENYQHWAKQSFASGWIGIESLNQTVLDDVDKRETIERVTALVRCMHEVNLLAAGYYMIGFESDTEESVRNDILQLAALGFDYCQICIVTPLPRTPLWYEIDSRFGILDHDWHHHDGKHLVWRHPHITPDRMVRLRDWAMDRCNPRTRTMQFISQLVRRYNELEGSVLRGLCYTLLRVPLHAWLFDARDRHQRYLFDESTTDSAQGA